MITLETINERGLTHIAMFIGDMVRIEGKDERKQGGMYFEKTWATPETCYWLYKFLKETGMYVCSEETIERLKNGTNHPEDI